MRIVCLQVKARCIGFGMMSLMASLLLFTAHEASAAGQQHARIAKDEIGWVYSRARFAKEFREFVTRGGALVPPATLDRQEVPSDTLSAWIMALAAKAFPPIPEPPWAGEVKSWVLIDPTERLRYQGMFNGTKMAYIGNDHFTALDTTATPRIRAKMQSAFGAPTETIVEARTAGQQAEFVQFEYWFVVNDTIPVIVMDARGPLDHGIVLAGDHRFREQLYAVRQSLLGRVIREAPYGAFVDYFYDDVEERWYRTGYDGSGFIVEPIRQPNLARGRPVFAARRQ